MREQDLARIAFVTRRFSDLQGLRFACFGALLVVGAVAGTFLPEGFGDPFVYIVLPAQNLMFGLSIVLSGYYERSFGRVPLGGRHPRSISRHQWDMASGAGLFIVLMGMYADMFKGGWRPGRHQPRRGGSCRVLAVDRVARLAASSAPRDWRLSPALWELSSRPRSR